MYVNMSYIASNPEVIFLYLPYRVSTIIIIVSLVCTKFLPFPPLHAVNYCHDQLIVFIVQLRVWNACYEYNGYYLYNHQQPT